MTVIRPTPPCTPGPVAPTHTDNETVTTKDYFDLLEEVKQLRAAISVYRHLVNRLLYNDAPRRRAPAVNKTIPFPIAKAGPHEKYDVPPCE